MRNLVCILGLFTTASLASASAQMVPENLLPSAAVTVASTNLPPMPPGKSTVMGGQIGKVDMVRDQFALKVAGGHTVKILFDERTQVYQNGKKISVMEMHPEEHASIETTLDGTAIFALRVHMLSDLPDGHVRARVVSYDHATGELKVRVSASNDSIRLQAAEGTPIARVGQAQFAQQSAGLADLAPGSVIDVSFRSGKAGPATATRIDVVAVPGAEFVFRGSLSSLDLRSGRMSIASDSDRPMDIAFEPAHFEVSHDLHEGSPVKVTARFDGTRYVASSIAVE